MFLNCKLDKEEDLKYQDLLKEKEKIEDLYEKLKEEYQENHNILLEYLDKEIVNSIVAIIVNSRVTDVLRDDIITNVDILIRIREFVFKHYCNNSCN